jgi:hypothetical protein
MMSADRMKKSEANERIDPPASSWEYLNKVNQQSYAYE